MPNRRTPGTGSVQRGELEILQSIRRRTAGQVSTGVPLGIGDDCALLRPRPGEDLAVTTDLSLAGRHFRLEWHPAESVGHRTLARGLSDLAAMGARPLAAFLSLGLPRDLTRGGGRGGSWLDRFLDGFLALAQKHKTPLAGGDLAESPVAAADIVLIGAVRRRRALLRCGARVGDTVYVTGALGGAAAGLARLSALAAAARGRRAVRIPSELASELEAHLYPQPRLAQGQWLVARQMASAGMDISDGLSTDLAHLCDESGVAAVIKAGDLPVHAGADLQQALHGGEDYELLFTARPAARVPQSIAGVAVTPIGRIVPAEPAKPRVTLVTPQGERRLAARGWEHFA